MAWKKHREHPRLGPQAALPVSITDRLNKGPLCRRSAVFPIRPATKRWPPRTLFPAVECPDHKAISALGAGGSVALAAVRQTLQRAMSHLAEANTGGRYV